jgi:RimJ/RimL family protein N-acetyltransferase
MHVASFNKRWLSKSLLFVVFGYPFLQLGCLKVIGRVAAHNNQALEFDLKLGFKEEARIRDVYPEGDLLILTMRRDQCRWLNLTPTLPGAVNGEE